MDWQNAWRRLAPVCAYFGFMWSHGKRFCLGGRVRAGAEMESQPGSGLVVVRFRSNASCAILAGFTHRSERCINEIARAVDSIGKSGVMWPIQYFRVLRFANDQARLFIVGNLTPVRRHGYRIGVPLAGGWEEIFNSDSGFCFLSNAPNEGRIESSPIAAHRHACSVELILPPLATISLRDDG